MPNINNDQELLSLVNTGVSPNVRDDQDALLIVEQRLIPAIIHTNVDQELFLVIEQRGIHGTLSASATVVPGNGVAQATITATVVNINGAPQAGISVTLQQNGNARISSLVTQTTNANGEATWIVSDANAELVTFSAVGVAFNNTVTIQFTALRVDGTVYSQTGPVAAGSQVYVVEQPANTNSIPPSPLLAIFADPNAQEPVAQPLVANGLGAYDFYAENALFMLVVINGSTKEIYKDQEVGIPTALFHNLEWWVKSNQGPSVPGAQVFVVGQPANMPQTLQKGPPSPLVQVYAGANAQVPLSQPLITDTFGYATCYAAPGAYTVLVYLNGALQQSYEDQSVGAVSEGPVFRRDGWVRTANGVAVANARVIVANQPCTIPGALVPQFPSNLAAIYSDVTGLVPISQSLTYNANGNPVIQSLTTDGNGHYKFYAAPNVPLTISVYSKNMLQYNFPDQILS